MSTKDPRFHSHCVICKETLAGSDDAQEVFDSLKEQVEEGIDPPNCGLCGDECESLAAAKKIVAKGPPQLYMNGKKVDRSVLGE